MSELLGSAYKQILLSNFIVSIQFLVLHTQIQLTFDHALFMIHSWLYLWTPNHISRGCALGLENPVILMSARLVLKPIPHGCWGVCSVSQSCPTLCNPMDCSLPGPSVHGIFQARILEWVAFSFSKEMTAFILCYDLNQKLKLTKMQNFGSYKSSISVYSKTISSNK